MQTASAIVAFLLIGTSSQAAADVRGAGSPGLAGVRPVREAGEGEEAIGERDAAQTKSHTWQLDLAWTLLGEAWDENESTEWLSGGIAGIDRRVWRGIAIRGELLAVKVFQPGDDAWLWGVTAGSRVRWRNRTVSPVVDVAVGVSDATRPIPPRGTSFNYLAVIGAGFELPPAAPRVTVTGRWLHASNNGREGRGRNPDIQSLGLVFSVGWR
jgi:hypothetical protein